MATKLKEVDVLIVGMGWTGGILAKELSEAGLSVLALERGDFKTTADDYSLPNIRDELRYAIRQELMQNASRDTLSARNNPSQEALPVRRLGSFLPGEGVGGSAIHWSGGTWRWTDMDFKIRSQYEEKYGKKYIPADMTIQDWGITYSELEPYYDKFEKVAGVSGKAGNIKGVKQSGGNPFEGSRANEYPLPPLKNILSAKMFEDCSKNLGYHPFPRPSANASQAYTNPDGSSFGACQYCGYCQRFGCEANAKGGPQMTVIPIAMKKPNFELRTSTWVTKINKDSTGKKVTGVTYTNLKTGDEFEQPANIVLMCAFAFNNVHLMLLSKIGIPYDPVSGKGIIGKNYAYDTGVGTEMFFEGRNFNPFISAGGTNTVIDDFHGNWDFDRSQAGFVGGYIVSAGHNTSLPIGYRPVPRGTPMWGSQWKSETAKWYQTAMSISTRSGVLPHRHNYYDLDPTYKNAFGQPLMRLTFDYQENEFKLDTHGANTINQIVQTLNPTKSSKIVPVKRSWNIVPYQSTHSTGGTIMGNSPGNSAVNKYQQSWDCPNLFVLGASVFVHNSAYQPTGLVGALAYWTADAIKNKYLKNPGKLMV
jgi:gluconate 2-dehydrogenase alpha chain